MQGKGRDPVPVVAAEPLPVIVSDGAVDRADVVKGKGVTLAPTTTEQEDITTKGQRHINRVWEYSQAAIALMISGAIVYCAIFEITSAELSNGFFLIIGFYFSRVNHQAIGGVGKKPSMESYKGR